MASTGPMFGHADHFVKYAPEKIEYAINRYRDETNCLAGVLETRLSSVPCLAGDSGIADIATWTWVHSASTNGNSTLAKYPNLKRWHDTIFVRDAVKRGLEKSDEICV